MAVLIIHLSDLHAHAENNCVIGKWDHLCRAVASELHGIDTCIIVFSGDAAFGGKAEQFKEAIMLLQWLQESIKEKSPSIVLATISVPGNHDCDLTSEDQNARVTLRNDIKADNVPSSVKKYLLKPQENYFLFSKDLMGTVEHTLSTVTPFYNSVDIKTKDGAHILRFHLVNSAWTSLICETQDLRFPLTELRPPATPTADFSVTVIHHPYHWFLAPDVRPGLRDFIEANSDLVLTGHEHTSEVASLNINQRANLSYLAGGVLQEKDNPSLCTFNLVRLDFEASSRLIQRYSWSDNHFTILGGAPQPETLMVNSVRRDKGLRLTRDFERQLDELEDLVNHPRTTDIRLSQIFSYPDLRKHEDSSQDPADKSKASTPTKKWVRSDLVFSEIEKQRCALIIGGDKAGKTSLARQLFAEMHRLGKAPLFICGKGIPASGNPEGLKKMMAKLLQEQYQGLDLNRYTQLPAGSKVLIVDDLQDGPTDHSIRRRMLEFFNSSFGQIVLLSSDEFYIESLSELGTTPTYLVPFILYDICDFGQARLHDLASRWIKLHNPEVTSDYLRTAIGDLCEKVELVLATAGLPHTPWLLIVLIENAESAETVNARNGAYGKLYEAVITAALYQSKLKSPDIDGKYLYLARLAYHLHTSRKASISDADMRIFHDAHCKSYDWIVDYPMMRDDLVATRILRQDGGSISFRVKYLYCYFLAHWLQRNIHTEASRKEIHELSQRLHHDVSSNVLVMLASLTQDPIVLAEMRIGTAKLFAAEKAAEIFNDVAPLNELDVPENILTLPHTSPEVNRKLIREAYDERHLQNTNENHDGRLIKSLPESDEAKIGDSQAATVVTKEIKEIRAAIRTMNILGQVLRNGAASQTAEEKLAIMEEIVMLGRRILGRFYSHLHCIGDMVAFTQDIFYRVLGRMNNPEITFDDTTPRDAGQIEKARLFSNRFWFELYAMGTFGIVKRMGTAVGISALDPTTNRLLAKDRVVANRLVQIETKLKRRAPRIPVDEILALHADLKREGNNVARTVLEMMLFDRLYMYETHYQDAQKICTALNIKRIPSQAYDPAVKRFTPGA
jgi:hypothetical protein